MDWEQFIRRRNRTIYAYHPGLEIIAPEKVADYTPAGNAECFEGVWVQTLSCLLHVALVGDIDAFRELASRVVDVGKAEGVDFDEAYGKEDWTRLTAFLKTGLRDSEDVEMEFGEHAKLPNVPYPTIWRSELCYTHPTLEKRSWKTRTNPLDVLRCAALFLSTSANAPPTAADEAEGLLAVMHFLALSQDNDRLAYRRSQALMYALDVSVKRGLHDEALQLLIELIQDKTVPLVLLWTSAVLLPHFQTFFLRVLAILETPPPPSFSTPTPTTITTEWGILSIDKLESLRQMRKTDAKIVQSFDSHIFGTPPAPGANPVPDSLQLLEYYKIPLGKMTPPDLLYELAKASRRAAIANGAAEQHSEPFKARPGATLYGIKDTEARLGFSLPYEYKRLLQVANGWISPSSDVPALAPIEEISVIKLDKPILITHSAARDDETAPFRAKNPYDREATFSEGIRIDSPSSSSGSMVLIIRDVDLKEARAPKRTKGNDGNSIEFTRGDYRVVWIRRNDDGTTSYSYYTMVRLYVEAAILELDKAVPARQDAKRDRSHVIWHRRAPKKRIGEKVGNSDDDDDDEDNDNSGDDDDDDDGDGGNDRQRRFPQPNFPVATTPFTFPFPGTPLAAAAGTVSSFFNPAMPGNHPITLPVAPRPACWYGTECRTQHHNQLHAARFDHTGPNTSGNRAARASGSGT